jgi:hypothetical protein
MEPRPPSVRVACARLAALRRWRPDDAPAIQQAQRELLVAQAAALTSRATAMLRGRVMTTPPEPYRMQSGETWGTVDMPVPTSGSSPGLSSKLTLAEACPPRQAQALGRPRVAATPPGRKRPPPGRQERWQPSRLRADPAKMAAVPAGYRLRSPYR